MKLNVEALEFSYNSRVKVLNNIHFEALPGEITAIIGPNASGKSTLLKCIAGMLRANGIIRLDEMPISKFSKDKRAQQIGYLPQENVGRPVLTVVEAVLLGRVHSLSWRISNDDLRIVSTAIEQLGIEKLASRFLYELSGGQKQIVSIAQALVRNSQILLLDEPLNSLDLRHELDVLDLLREITVRNGLTTVIALHDLNLTARYADRVAILKEGAIHSFGAPETVLTSQTIDEVYGINCSIVIDDGALNINPHGAFARRISAGPG